MEEEGGGSQESMNKDMEEVVEDEVVKKPWSKLVVEFTQDTTLHGIRFVTGESKFITRKYEVFWDK